MKNSIYIYLCLCLLVSCSDKMILNRVNQCVLISELLMEENINLFIESYDHNKVIRINDLSGYFRENNCGFRKFSVKVVNNYMVDLNTGRYIDISVLSVHEKNNILKFDIFYSQRTPECEFDFLKMGEVVFENKNNKFILKTSKFNLID